MMNLYLNMLKIAHRGYTKNHSDNSLQAFYDAILHNFDMIELDIQLDKNKNIIIMHDIHINYELVENMYYEEIKYHYPNTLLLSTFFEKFNYKSIKLYFDLKGKNELATILHEFVLEHNIDIGNIWFASFNLNHIDILQSANSNYKLGLITDNLFTLEIMNDIISKYKIKFVCFLWVLLNTQLISFLKKNNIMTFVYTLKETEMLPWIQKYNIDGIVSDIDYD